MKIGILAIQGDFELHRKALTSLSINSSFVRSSKDLDDIKALILPGGESTTMSLLMNKFDLFNSIRKFSDNFNLFGTCAGAILMSAGSGDQKVKNLGLINVFTKRNSWGAQIDSFSDIINLSKNEILSDKFYATFIRGPRFLKVSKDCKVIGRYKNEPVLIRNDKHLISSFHPEIGKDLSIHKYFINMINE
ncbi:MAG: pyridoxal 5'-phosphate synthase glutaminase subunit PdxT [Candidatus Marinimicrobia bacterium]|nr:pyridoxal 5'-phosphate synthase glutaminase subunit PdxT [Candidatus Neomarinimicrobiota bacterium]